MKTDSDLKKFHGLLSPELKKLPPHSKGLSKLAALRVLLKGKQMVREDKISRADYADLRNIVDVFRKKSTIGLRDNSAQKDIEPPVKIEQLNPSVSTRSNLLLKPTKVVDIQMKKDQSVDSVYDHDKMDGRTKQINHDNKLKKEFEP